jgi:uncharacterized protein (TIGR00369 family)
VRPREIPVKRGRVTLAAKTLSAGPRHGEGKEIAMPVATALDDFARPPCAELLGWEMVHARPAEGWVRIRFEGKPEFRNPAGFIQGGLLSAMLDDTMGPAVFVMTEGALYTVTLNMNVAYVAPAKVGPIFGEGRVVHLGKSTAFLEGELRDDMGLLIARATSTARLVPAEKALAKAARSA